MNSARPFTLVIVTALILCLLSPAASPCRAEEGPTIAAVEVRGLKSISPAEFLGKIKTRKGTIFSAETLADDIQRLAEQGIIVTVTQEPRGDEIVIIFDVVAEDTTPEVDEVRFKGGPAGNLKDLVRIRRGSRLAEYLLKADSARIADYLAEKGYADAIVTTRVEPSEPGKVNVTFDISKGPKFQLKRLEFVGNEHIARGELEKAMVTKVDTWLTSREFIAKSFDDDITRVSWLYVSRGYLDAVVEADEPSMDHETGRVEVVIRITEGPRYTIAELNFTGNEVISDEALTEVVRLRPGSYYAFRELQADVEALTDFYTTGDRGFALVSVRRQIEKGAEPATILLTFIIDEGKPTYIRRIHTRGNYKTRKKVVVREMRIEPGDMYDSDLIRKSERRLKDLQYFTKIDVSHLPAPPPKVGAVEGAEYVDLIVEVEETETGRLLVGAGFNTNSSLIGQISLEQRNFDVANLPDFKRYGLAALSPSRCFIGGGQVLRLVAQPGTDRSRYFFEFEEPWLLDYPVEFYLSGYLFERFYDGYSVGRKGGTIGIGKRFTRKFKANIRYRREEIDIGGIDASSPIDAARQEGKHDLGAWRVSATYDTRDSTIFPTKGGTIGTYAELAGVPAGGNVNFWKYGLNGSLFIKLWEFPKETANVLHLKAETGLAGPAFGDDEVPIYERYFAGGIGSMRGFAFRGIGPRQAAGGDTSLGGDFLFLGSAEYVIPLYKEDYQGYIFTDVGTVSRSIQADAFSKLRTSVGFGFRFSLPVMGRIPLTLNFGFPIDKEPEDERQVFNFALGLFF